MNLAKFLEEALRQKGVDATVSEPASGVNVTATYALGDVYVTVDGPMKDIDRIHLQNSGGDCIMFSGEDAQAFVELMHVAMQGMERTE